MKCKIFGQIVTREYYVNEERDDKELFKWKPALRYETKIDNEEILETNMDCHNFSDYANTDVYGMKFNISEEEEVYAFRKVFRADLGEIHIFTKKEVKLNEVNKESSEALLEKLLKEWNKQQVEANQEYSDYCKLHGLNPEEVDLDLLQKLVPQKTVKLSQGGLSFGPAINWVKCYDTKPFYMDGSIGVIKNGINI